MPDLASPATLIEMLQRRAAEQPEQPAFRFIDDETSYGALLEMVDRFAGRLLDAGIGDGARVVLVLPNGPEFFAAFYGSQRAGAIPVPIFPESGIERCFDLAVLCNAAAVVVAPRLPSELFDAFERRAAGEGRQLITVDGSGRRPEAHELPSVDADHIAFLQYTSGSTGDPKGVVLTHNKVLTNVQQMIAGMEITEDEVFISWLPVHHDMGLILMTMVPFYLAARLILLPTGLADVRQWLDAIARHQGTFTAAPDFAYRLCLRSVRDPSRYDLSSLRVALNAAEPVRADTIRRFESAFGLEHVMVPGYGLAEATVGVAMQPAGTPFVVDERGFVAIGRPFPRVEVRIADGDQPAQEDVVGELVVRSPAATTGYFDNPEATAGLFWRPGWIRTGDLGYRRADGELFIVGRSKSIIIQAGRNIAPQEIEESVEALAFVRRAAAVGIDRGRAEGEQAHVFVELRRAQPPAADQLADMAVEIVARFHDRLGLRPGRVLLLKPRSIPLTANGKIRYPALRQAYLEGTLRTEARIVFPEY